MFIFNPISDKPYGTIKEGWVGYQNDSYNASQVLSSYSKNYDEETTQLIASADSISSIKLLTPYSGKRRKKCM